MEHHLKIMPNRKTRKCNILKLSVTARLKHGTRHPTFLKAKLKPKLHRATHWKKDKRNIGTETPGDSEGSGISLEAESSECHSSLPETQPNESCSDKKRNRGGRRSTVVGIGECLTMHPFSIEPFISGEPQYPKFANSMNDNSQESESEEEPLYYRFNSAKSPAETIIVNPVSVAKTSITQKNKSEKVSYAVVDDATAHAKSASIQECVVNGIIAERNVEEFRNNSKSVASNVLNKSFTPEAGKCTTYPDIEMEVLNTSTGSEWEDISTADELLRETSSCDTDNMALEQNFCILFQKTDFFTMVMKHPVMLSVIGKIQVKVLYGCLDVLGFRLTPQSGFAPIYSPQSNSRIVIATCPTTIAETDTHSEKDKLLQKLLTFGYLKEEAWVILKNFNSNFVILQCRKLSNTACSYVTRYHHNLFDVNKKFHSVADLDPEFCYGCTFCGVSKTRSIVSDNYWRQIATDIGVCAQYKAPLRIIICGGKGVGKSTVSCYLVNSLLNVCDRVCYMDGDPGQPEFTPPGLVSLLEITQPCLGPAFTHHQKPKMSIFIGGTSVGELPSHYAKCIHEMWKYYLQHDARQQPVLVNTMGWNKGIGVALLVDLINIIRPTHVVQVNNTCNPAKNFPKLLSPEYVQSLSGWVTKIPDVPLAYKIYRIETKIQLKKNEFSPKILREINLLAYLSTLQQQADNVEFQPLNCLNSYKVPWSSIALHVCHAKVANSEILYVFNASIVAMCSSDTKEFISTKDPTLPKFLSEIPICHCLGYGIVKGISMEEKCFYVLTSLNPEELLRVNVLLRGAVDLPQELLQEQTVDVPIPYLTKRQSTSRLHIGQKTVKPRNFKMNRTSYVSH